MHVLYDPVTHKILGRARGTEANSVYVPDDLWGRLAADSSAFLYVPETNTVELDPTFHYPVENEAQSDIAVSLMLRGGMEFHVPELGLNVSFGGEFGAIFCQALALVQYAPQRIVGRRSGAIETVMISESDAAHIARAYALHMEQIDD